MRVREKLKAGDLAKRITLGPVAIVALMFTAILFLGIIVLEVRDPESWRLLAENNPNIFGWLLKVLWVWIFKPLCCIGVAYGIYTTRSAKAQEQFNNWLDRFSKRTYIAQSKRNIIQQLIVAISGTVALIAFSLGLYVGYLVLLVFFHLIDKPIRALARFLEEDRLKRYAMILGIVMITTAFIIRLTN